MYFRVNNLTFELTDNIINVVFLLEKRNLFVETITNEKNIYFINDCNCNHFFL